MNLLCMINGHRWHLMARRREKVDHFETEHANVLFVGACLRCGKPAPDGLTEMFHEDDVRAETGADQ